MPQNSKTPVIPGQYYHIYNRGVNRRTIFKDEQDARRFLYLLNKYMNPAGNTFAYALMEDHFHLLINTHSAKLLPAFLIKDDKVLGRTFGHLQNAYAKYFNLRYGSVSAVFERSYEREVVSNINYFRNLVIYIHRNPIKHGKAKAYDDYPWTSFHELLDPMLDSFLARDQVWQKFEGLKNFEFAHIVNAKHNYPWFES